MTHIIDGTTAASLHCVDPVSMKEDEMKESQFVLFSQHKVFDHLSAKDMSQ